MHRERIAGVRWDLERWRRSPSFVVIAAALGVACGGLAADGPASGTSPPDDAVMAGNEPRQEPAGAAGGLDAEGESLLDAAIQLMVEDVRGVPEGERRFMRYVTVSHVRNTLDPRDDRVEAESSAGLDAFAARETGREIRRTAVTKLANSVSLAATPRQPQVVGDDRLFQRIDMRHYAWDRPLALGGGQFADGWEAIVSQALMAVEYRGELAGELAQMTGATIPWLMADDFVAAVASGALYYSLLGLPDRLEALQARLEAGAGVAPTSLRAGFEYSGLSYSPRGLERRGLAGDDGYWQAFDFASDARGQALFVEPLSFVPDATEVIFTLPNGLNGYFTADASGQRVAESPLSNGSLTDPAQPDGLVRNAASCFGCHNTGIIPFRDAVRDRLMEEPNAAPERLGTALAAYPEARVLDQLANSDSARYIDALRAAGIPDGLPDRVSQVFLGFGEDVGPQQAADELFVAPALLQRELGGLGRTLAPLASGSVGRREFATAYVAALCQLHPQARNRPAACAP